MDERQIKFFKGWAIFFIVAAVCATIAGFVAGAIVGFICGVAGVDVESIKAAGAVAGFVVGMPISFVCYKWSIRRFILPQTSIESGQTSEGSLAGVTGP